MLMVRKTHGKTFYEEKSAIFSTGGTPSYNYSSKIDFISDRDRDRDREPRNRELPITCRGSVAVSFAVLSRFSAITFSYN